tara:strand:- start:109 stop:363 length:255 start_codon:yes stop_codon:yes gene_type:complete
MEDRNFYHLLVNPYKVNRNIKNKNESNDPLLIILKKKYLKYKFEDKDIQLIIKNIEEISYNLYIKNLTNNIVDKIIQNTINELG